MSDKVKPFTPAEAQAAVADVIPGFVVKAVNTLLAQKVGIGLYPAVRFTRSEVEAAIRMAGRIDGGSIDPNWLNFESMYREQGWKVEYDKPGYNETYEAFWVFKAASR
jgi:hypothetical protein